MTHPNHTPPPTLEHILDAMGRMGFSWIISYRGTDRQGLPGPIQMHQSAFLANRDSGPILDSRLMARFDEIGDLVAAIVAQMSRRLRQELEAALESPEVASADETAENPVHVSKE